ncbi:MAG: helix-turn-helix domain-containing protein [Burkholderiaceae bacterium]
MPHQTPRQLPETGLLLDGIAGSERDVARALGVSHRTVRRWRANDSAPRAARVAMFWMSTWGRQHAWASLVCEADLYRSYSSSLLRELADARASIARLRRALDEAPGGSANSSIYDDARPVIDAGRRRMMANATSVTTT